MATPRTVILAAVDDSALSEHVVTVAASLAHTPTAELHLTHVVDALPTPSASVGGSAVALPGPQELIRIGHELLTRLVGTALALGARPTGHLRLGITWKTIVQLATDIDADVLVVGTHDPGGLERLLLGSVTEILVRKAPCSVVVVRPKRGVAKAIVEIEPPCPDCLAAQRASGGATLWCARHSEHHRAAHTYEDVPDSFAMGSLTIRPD